MHSPDNMHRERFTQKQKKGIYMADEKVARTRNPKASNVTEVVAAPDVETQGAYLEYVELVPSSFVQSVE